MSSIHLLIIENQRIIFFTITYSFLVILYWCFFCNRRMPKIISTLKIVWIKTRIPIQKLLKCNFCIAYIMHMFHARYTLIIFINNISWFLQVPELELNFCARQFFFNKRVTISVHLIFMTKFRRVCFTCSCSFLNLNRDNII